MSVIYHDSSPFSACLRIISTGRLTGKVGIEAIGHLQIGMIPEVTEPDFPAHEIRFTNDLFFVHREHFAIPQQPSSVDHDGFNVAGLSLVDENGDGPQRGDQMSVTSTYDDQVRLAPDLQESAAF